MRRLAYKIMEKIKEIKASTPGVRLFSYLSKIKCTSYDPAKLDYLPQGYKFIFIRSHRVV